MSQILLRQLSRCPVLNAQNGYLVLEGALLGEKPYPACTGALAQQTVIGGGGGGASIRFSLFLTTQYYALLALRRGNVVPSLSAAHLLGLGATVVSKA
jgi:hypothetical protein